MSEKRYSVEDLAEELGWSACGLRNRMKRDLLPVSIILGGSKKSFTEADREIIKESIGPKVQFSRFITKEQSRRRGQK
jgi:hypothetical protein